MSKKDLENDEPAGIIEQVENVENAFKEKTWGKDDGDLHIIDGFSFRGKQRFLKALVCFKEMLKRGVKQTINDVNIKVLDRRTKGLELEIEIEMYENENDRGIAVLKLYGPNKKKENVITVTKSKESDSKFVKILAKQIVKPLIKTFLLGNDYEEPTEKKSNNAKSELLKCTFCDKTSYSPSGLKGHMTKMHAGIQKSQSKLINKPLGSDQGGSDANDEAKEVVELLLNDILEISDEDDSEIQIVTLAEESERNMKTYTNKCDDCCFEAEAYKKYQTVQMMLKHKETCLTKKDHTKCEQCNYTAKNSLDMKRHMRDNHEVLTSSTSPPPKRKRKQEPSDLTEEMEIDSNVKDLSFVMEDMVIEENEEETLSRRMDEKIRMKSNRKEAEDVLYDMKLNKRNERKNQIAKKEKLTATLNIVKKRKQQVKLETVILHLKLAGGDMRKHLTMWKTSSVLFVVNYFKVETS